MNEQFSNPTLSIEGLPQFEKVELNPVSLKLRAKALTKWAITFIIYSGSVFYFLLLNGWNPWIALPIGLIGIFMLVGLIDLFLKQKFYGYALRAKDIIFRSGYISTQTMIIPFNRVQHSAIHQSFLDKLFGIASLKVYTAGGSGSDLRIPGLTLDLAEKLNEALSQKVAEH